jgi:hypothetical protein
LKHSLATLSGTFAKLRAADGAQRPAVEAAEASTFATATTTVLSYTSKYCPASVPPSPNLPGVGAAKQTACLQDQATIKQAEDLYSTLNGSFATLPELVSAQFLRQVSSYYADVRIDDPPGGYTLVAVANGPCANVPVAG